MSQTNYTKYFKFNEIEESEEIKEEPKEKKSFKKHWKNALYNIKKMKNFITQMNERYDPFKNPPNWEIAENHRKATQVGYEVEMDEEQERALCFCCGHQIEKIPVGLNEPSGNLSFLGPGFPLYFDFLKNTIFLLITILLISGEFNLITNFLSNNCVDITNTDYASTETDSNPVSCVLDWVTFLSLANKTNRYTSNDIQHYLNFFCLIGVIVFMIYYRKSQKELFLHNRWKDVTPADYTIAIKNLPNNLEIEVLEKKLKEYFLKFNPRTPYQIQNINFCYDLTERDKLFKSYEQLLKKKTKLVKKRPINFEEEFENIETEIIFKEEEMRDYDLNLQKNKLQFCGIAFVTFNTQKEKREILEKSHLTWIDRIKIFFNKDVNLERGFLFHGSRLIIESAPQPNEILFNNLNSNSREKFKRRFITFFLTVLELGGFGISIYYLLSLQYNYFSQQINELDYEMNSSDEATMNQYYEMMFLLYVYSGFISLLIVVINNVLITFITKAIVKMEKYSTFTRKKISLSIRLSLILFFNNGVIVYLICSASDQITTPGGLLYTQSYVFIYNAVGPLLTKGVLDIPYFIKKIKIYIYKKYFPTHLIQKEANKLMQYPEYEIEIFYAETIQTILFTCFFSALLPAGIICSLVSLTLLYFMHKRRLLRQRSVTKMIGGELSRSLTALLELSIILTALSNFLFEYIIFQTYTSIDIIGLAISVAYFLSPTRYIAEKLFFYREPIQEKKYSDIMNRFPTDYNIENPVTSFQALKKKLKMEKAKEVRRFQSVQDQKKSSQIIEPVVEQETAEKIEENKEQPISKMVMSSMKKSLVPSFVRLQHMETMKKIEILESPTRRKKLSNI